MQAAPTYSMLLEAQSPSDELLFLTQTTDSMDELLEQVDALIETRFFNPYELLLSDEKTNQWLWWERARKNFSQLVESLEEIH